MQFVALHVTNTDFCPSLNCSVYDMWWLLTLYGLSSQALFHNFEYIVPFICWLVTACVFYLFLWICVWPLVTVKRALRTISIVNDSPLYCLLVLSIYISLSRRAYYSVNFQVQSLFYTMFDVCFKVMQANAPILSMISYQSANEM